MAGNDGSFGGGYRYGWQPGMTNWPDWLTEMAYTRPDLAEYAKLRGPEFIADIDRRTKQLGIIPR